MLRLPALALAVLFALFPLAATAAPAGVIQPARTPALPPPSPQSSPAQAVAATDGPQQQLSESVSVGYVMVPFTVLGAKGEPLTDLREQELSLMVDGEPVKNDLFERSTNAPVSFTILVDGSGSMALAGKLDAARAAVATLLAHRLAGDDFSLYVFAAGEAHEVVPFTDDAVAISKAMNAVQPYGKTAFFDALATMPDRSRLGRNPTRAIILLSDGIDNASHLTRSDLAHLLQGLAIPIYPLGLRNASEMRLVTDASVDAAMTNEALTDVDLLDEVAILTGGKLYLGDEPEQLAQSVDAIEQSLRAQYLVGFSPTGKGGVKYRHISLRLAGRVRSVRVRAGYLGTEPPVLSAASSRVKTKRNERKGSS